MAFVFPSHLYRGVKPQCRCLATSLADGETPCLGTQVCLMRVQEASCLSMFHSSHHKATVIKLLCTFTVFYPMARASELGFHRQHISLPSRPLLWAPAYRSGLHLLCSRGVMLDHPTRDEVLRGGSRALHRSPKNEHPKCIEAVEFAFKFQAIQKVKSKSRSSADP